ncbi:hypothetical protein CspeluHIS016_0601670 [Cutaneotrichosporon spelunceum]|uniref:Uncharacterized protein n=1 Tax=Cutaneotrichosporon spelunceum TaxID=1672016 RepID=A0AAD3TXH8_9TREE|nr:hypothetical protein CspeluHIS016_0601670 [Cutaneotrichosporon spelunceum]
MPYISPKDVARARANAAVVDLDSTLEHPSLAPETQTGKENENEHETEPSSESHEGTEATETEAEAQSDALPSPSHSPNAPSLLSCGTDSSNSLHTLSSVADEYDLGHVDLVEDELYTSPEMAQYHRDMIAFTKPLYDRAKMIVERKLRVQRARGIVR